MLLESRQAANCTIGAGRLAQTETIYESVEPTSPEKCIDHGVTAFRRFPSVNTCDSLWRYGRELDRFLDVRDGHLELLRVDVAPSAALGLDGAPDVEALTGLENVPHAGHGRGGELLDGLEGAARADGGGRSRRSFLPGNGKRAWWWVSRGPR